jgi:CRP-like cAMP-binding protein
MNPHISINPGVWKHNNGQSPLAVFFQAIHPIDPKAIEAINAETFPVVVAKGRFLVKPGFPTDHLYLIVRGVVRGYIKDGKKEITTWINEENEIVGSIRNLGIEISTEEYLQALEKAELVAIPISLINYLYENFIEANIIGRKILEDNYRGAEERAYISRIPSAVKRYKRFVETRPGLLNRIPLKYIASYLGMTVETMSRTRSHKKSLEKLTRIDQ